VRRSKEGNTRIRNELHAVLFLPGDSRWHGFQPITGKEAREKQTKNKKNLHRSPPKKTETNEPNFALRAVGRLSSSNKQTNKKVLTKDRPRKKKKKTLQHKRARTKKKKTQQTKIKLTKKKKKKKQRKETK
jgi:hypothetical protein